MPKFQANNPQNGGGVSVRSQTGLLVGPARTHSDLNSNDKMCAEGRDVMSRTARYHFLTCNSPVFQSWNVAASSSLDMPVECLSTSYTWETKQGEASKHDLMNVWVPHQKAPVCELPHKKVSMILPSTSYYEHQDCQLKNDLVRMYFSQSIQMHTRGVHGYCHPANGARVSVHTWTLGVARYYTL